jgi:hypothetical protein
MGADIYIESLADKCKAEFEPKFHAAVAQREAALTEKDKQAAQVLVEKYHDAMYTSGYFRDSYNGTSLFWLLGLSWWKDVKTDDEGKLSIPKMKDLLAEIQSRKIPNLPELLVYLEEKGVALDEGENSPQVWKDYFTDKRDTFIKFLETAIEIEEPIYCSC